MVIRRIRTVIVLNCLLNWLIVGCFGEENSAVPPSTAARLTSNSALEKLDYSNLDYWACSSAIDNDICDRTYETITPNTDGTEVVTTAKPAADPPVDCFYIYPTVDFRPSVENHEDLTDVELPLQTIIAQAAPFGEVCRVFAPLYRQATLFTYSGETSDAVDVFKNAFADVANAFEHYLQHWNKGRPIVIMGHSQGAQHATYLLNWYFDGDQIATEVTGSETTTALRSRLVAALPIGFRIFAAKGERVGGSLESIPACKSIDETGCLIHYRSYTDGDDFERLPRIGDFEIDRVLSGQGYVHRAFDVDNDALICVNPATTPATTYTRFRGAEEFKIEDGQIYTLASAQFLGAVGDLSGLEGRRHLDHFYSATCRFHEKADNYLAIGAPATTVNDIREDLIPIESGLTKRLALGLHLWDFSLGMGDLIEQIRSKTNAWQTAQP